MLLHVRELAAGLCLCVPMLLTVVGFSSFDASQPNPDPRSVSKMGAKERTMWDALSFGYFLQEAEDDLLLAQE